MELVANCGKYWEFMRNLRNAPDIQKYLIEQVHITKDMQEEYMAKHEKSYYICLLDNDPVGYIGIKENEVGLVVVPSMQGRDVGKFMLRAVKNNMYPGHFARIKEDNIASIRLFESCGYKLKYKKNNVLYYV